MALDSERYARQLSLPGFSPASQQSLADAHVLCIGAGGLGSPALLYLAAAGVGTITIIDDDTVERSNLHRQVIHTDSSVGTPKVESASAALTALNPTVKVHTLNKRLTWPESLDICQDVDLVLDGSDNFDTRYIASTTCARLGIPHIWASILGFDAQLSVFWAEHGPVYEDIFPEPPAPGTVPSCSQAGVLGPVVGIVGSAMAMEALKILTGLGTPLLGTLAYYDSLSGRWEYIPITGKNDTLERLRTQPPAHTPHGAITTTIDPNRPLIDVREPNEYATNHIPGAHNIPLSTIESGTNGDVPDHAILYCEAGIRSERAQLLLTEKGIRDLLSYEGGIRRWRKS